MSTPVFRSTVRVVVGLSVTGCFVWLLAHQIRHAELRLALAQISPFALLLATALLAVGYTLRVVRWWAMLRVLDPQIPLRACVWPFLVSIATNNLMPLRAGDALRVVGFQSRLGAPAARVLGTLLIERLMDLLTLLGIFFVGLMGASEDSLPRGFANTAATLTAATMLSLVLLITCGVRLQALSSRLLSTSRIPASLARRAGRASHELFATLGLLRSPSLTAGLIVLSAGAWAFEGALFVTVARSLDISTAAAGPWFALASGTLATLLPSSPGHVGTFDYFAALGLTAYGANVASAAAFAIVVHVLLWVPLTAAGLLYFASPGRWRLRRVEAPVSSFGGLP